MKHWYEDNKAIALVTYLRYVDNMSTTEIAKILNTRFGYQVTPKNLRGAMSDWGIASEPKNVRTFNEITDKINKRLGLTDINYKIPKSSKSKDELILVTSDYHSPFYSKDAVKEVISRYGVKGPNKAAKLVLSGDIWDSYSISRFLPERDIRLIDEFNETVALIKTLAENFPQVILLKGNHEDRVLKYFLNHGVGIDKMFLVNYDWPRHISSLLPNVFVAANNVGGHNVRHYYICGDLAVGHFEVSGNGMLGAVKKMEEWANKWKKYSDLSKCKVFLQGHTHFLGRAEIYGGEVTIGETGCMCDIQEYAVKADGKYSPGVNGWWEIYQQNGITDRIKSRYIVL